MTPRRQLTDLSRRLDRLTARAEELHAARDRDRKALAKTQAFLDLAPQAADLLEELSKNLFGEILDEIENGLTQAVREILGQERRVFSRPDTSRGRLNISFHIEQDADQEEDILTGQGGSVLNIISVSLRLMAISRLDPANHRPFLVLDEQDCWLKPELVPRFMGVIAAVAERLGLQVLVISHHPLDLFANNAPLIYGLAPSRETGVKLTTLKDER